MQTDCHSDDIEDNEISESTDLLVSSANVTQLTSPPHGEISYILGIRAPYEVCRGARNSLYVTIDCSDTNLRSILSSRTQSDYPGDLNVILVISVYHHYLTLVHNSSRQKAYSRISSQFLGFLPVLFTIIKSYYYVMRALLSFRNIDMQTSYYCYLHSIHFSFTIYTHSLKTTQTASCVVYDIIWILYMCILQQFNRKEEHEIYSIGVQQMMGIYIEIE